MVRRRVKYPTLLDLLKSAKRATPATVGLAQVSKGAFDEFTQRLLQGTLFVASPTRNRLVGPTLTGTVPEGVAPDGDVLGSVTKQQRRTRVLMSHIISFESGSSLPERYRSPKIAHASIQFRR